VAAITHILFSVLFSALFSLETPAFRRSVIGVRAATAAFFVVAPGPTGLTFALLLFRLFELFRP
jgi:hypothetical protein